MRCRPYQHGPNPPSLVRPGSDLSPRPCDFGQHGAQGRVKRGRRATPPSELNDARPPLDRPSTVLPWREAVPILGRGLTASADSLVSLSSAARPEMCRALAGGSAAAGVTRMGGNRVSGFRRAAVFGRAIARDPSPQGEGAAPTRGRHSPYVPGRVSIDAGSMGRRRHGQCTTVLRRPKRLAATARECHFQK